MKNLIFLFLIIFTSTGYANWITYYETPDLFEWSYNSDNLRQKDGLVFVWSRMKILDDPIQVGENKVAIFEKYEEIDCVEYSKITLIEKHFTDINSTTPVAEIDRTNIGKSYLKSFSAYGKLSNVVCANVDKYLRENYHYYI